MDSLRKEALHARLMAMHPGRIEPGLARVRRVAEHLGLDLEGRNTRWILVAGTNGKGSSVTFLAAIMEAAGHRVGRYTSPHLVDVSERIQVNSECIPSEAFVAHGVAALASAEESGVELTYFEVVTLVALLHFQQSCVDIGVLEVGLGGRLDATNIVSPSLAILTTIGMDHMEFLGDSLSQIAWEKGGVTRPEVPLVTGLPVRLHRASLRGRAVPANVWRTGEDFSLLEGPEGLVYQSSVGVRRDLRLGFEGAHQLHNGGLAVAGAEILEPGLSDRAVREGLLAARLPGRNEWIVRDGRADILLDGAHNLAAAEALRVTLDALPAELRVVGVLASRSGKDPSAFAAATGPRVRSWAVTTAPDTPRMLSAEETSASLVHAGMPLLGTWEDPQRALAEAEADAGPEGIVVVTGSLFLIGALKRRGQWAESGTSEGV
jgi:dihydrofolate synthase/folylpolyglutamate synthase